MLLDAIQLFLAREYGAPSQLEKIDMIDDADLIAINKFDRRGSEDALREVKKQVQRSRLQFDADWNGMPAYGTNASRFNDAGMNVFFAALVQRLNEKCGPNCPLDNIGAEQAGSSYVIIPDDRSGYLNEIAETVRGYRRTIHEQAEAASAFYRLEGAMEKLREAGDEEALRAHPEVGQPGKPARAVSLYGGRVSVQTGG